MEPIRTLVERTLSDRGLSRRLDRRLPLSVWTEAVGAELASRVRPTALTGGTLHLLVQDHRWRDQLDAARNLLIERINARLGKPLVRELRFGLAHEGALAPPASATRAPCSAQAQGPELPVPAGMDCRILRGRLGDELHEALLSAARAAARRASQGRP